MGADVEVLGRMSIFGGLAPATLSFLCEQLEQVDIAAGASFFREGEPGDGVYVLEEGRADVVKSRQDGSIVLAELGPGDCFGELAVLAIAPRSATVAAVSSCRAWKLPNRALYELSRRNLEQFALVQMNLARELARRLDAANELLLDLALRAGDADPKNSVAGRVGRSQ